MTTIVCSETELIFESSFAISFRGCRKLRQSGEHVLDHNLHSQLDWFSEEGEIKNVSPRAACEVVLSPTKASASHPMRKTNFLGPASCGNVDLNGPYHTAGSLPKLAKARCKTWDKGVEPLLRLFLLTRHVPIFVDMYPLHFSFSSFRWLPRQRSVPAKKRDREGEERNSAQSPLSRFVVEWPVVFGLWTMRLAQGSALSQHSRVSTSRFSTKKYK